MLEPTFVNTIFVLDVFRKTQFVRKNEWRWAHSLTTEDTTVGLRTDRNATRFFVPWNLALNKIQSLRQILSLHVLDFLKNEKASPWARKKWLNFFFQYPCHRSDFLREGIYFRKMNEHGIMQKLWGNLYLWWWKNL